MRSLLALICVLFSPFAFCKTIVISDIDDTIRSFHSGADYLELYDNAVDPARAFRGMSEIYKHISNSGAEIHYVSAVVEPFVGYSTNFLYVNQFPQDYNYNSKGWFEDTFDFKTRVIREILATAQPTDTIVLVGDNGDQDVRVCAAISAEYPSAIVFIHKLFPGELAQEQIPYLTGADFAAALEARGFLTPEQTSGVLKNILSDIQSGDAFTLDMIWPYWGETTLSEVESVFGSVAPNSDLDLIKTAIFYN